MLLTINGLSSFTSARLCFPLRGVWHLEGTLVEAPPLAGRVTIEGPGLSLWGSVQRSGATRGATSVRIVGGAARLGEEVPAASYRRAPVRTLVGNVIAAVGEALSPTSTGAVLDRIRNHSRARGSAAEELSSLADLEAATWRVLDDGSVFFGLDAWPVAPALGTGTVTPSENPSGSRATLAPEIASLRPGMLLERRRVAFVEYTLSPGVMRAEVEYA